MSLNRNFLFEGRGQGSCQPPLGLPLLKGVQQALDMFNSNNLRKLDIKLVIYL